MLFQYISCCSLSKLQMENQERNENFNTSHVVVYLRCQAMLGCPVMHFNTSHVVVYPEGNTAYDCTCEFQYISCCSLSEMRPRLVIIKINFNTSHVVVYRLSVYSRNSVFKFQYISCCSLSVHISHHLDPESHFNTSHVVVYLKRFAIYLRNIAISIHLML